jgi:CRP/FNR family nitrogen fixation transcriptional regulator
MCDRSLALQVWNTTAVYLQRAQSHVSVLGRSTAQERIATFLLDIDARLNSPRVIELPMPRRDIADYLGLTIETVSRILRRLDRRKIISIETWRHIVLRERKALLHMSDA